MCCLATARLKLLLSPAVCPTVLSWALYYFCMLPLSYANSKRSDVLCHCYADDIQLYVTLRHIGFFSDGH